MYSNLTINLSNSNLLKYHNIETKKNIGRLSKKYRDNMLKKIGTSFYIRKWDHDKQTGSLKDCSIKIIENGNKIIVLPTNKQETPWRSVTGNASDFLSDLPFFRRGNIEIEYHNSISVHSINENIFFDRGDLTFVSLEGFCKIIDTRDKNSLITNFDNRDQIMITTLKNGKHQQGKVTIYNPKNDPNIYSIAGQINHGALFPTKVCTKNRDIYEGVFSNIPLHIHSRKRFKNLNLEEGTMTFGELKLKGKFHLNRLINGSITMPYRYAIYDMNEGTDKKYATSVETVNSRTWQINFSPCYNNGYLKYIQINHGPNKVIVKRVIDEEKKLQKLKFKPKNKRTLFNNKDNKTLQVRKIIPEKKVINLDELYFYSPKKLCKFLSAPPMEQCGWNN